LSFDLTTETDLASWKDAESNDAFQREITAMSLVCPSASGKTEAVHVLAAPKRTGAVRYFAAPVIKQGTEEVTAERIGLHTEDFAITATMYRNVVNCQPVISRTDVNRIGRRVGGR